MLGDGPAVAAFLDKANTLAKAWQASQDARYELRQSALEVGLTGKQFGELLRGSPNTAEPVADATTN